MRRELEPPGYVLHPCAEPGCRTLAFPARCDVHRTDADHEHLVAVDAAILHAAELEQAWLAAWQEVLRLERAAGVRRADLQPGDVAA